MTNRSPITVVIQTWNVRVVLTLDNTHLSKKCAIKLSMWVCMYESHVELPLRPTPRFKPTLTLTMQSIISMSADTRDPWTESLKLPLPDAGRSPVQNESNTIPRFAVSLKFDKQRCTHRLTLQSQQFPNSSIELLTAWKPTSYLGDGKNRPIDVLNPVSHHIPPSSAVWYNAVQSYHRPFRH